MTNLKPKQSMSELDEKLKSLLITLSARILKCDESNVSWSDDIDEYGYESMQVNQLCADINTIFDIEINPSIFLEVTSLQALSEHLKTNYYAKIENNLL